MFGRKNKPHRPSIHVNQLASLIAEGVHIEGDITFASGMRIDGHVKGNVIARADAGAARTLLVLSDKGRVDGSVRCDDAVINGTVTGDLEVAHFLELQAGARVNGTIRYRQLQMDVGAAVQGQLVQAEPVATTADAAPVE